MTEPSNESLFVGIKDSNDIRKNLLESSKSMILCLQKYEKIRFVREEKEKEIQRLKSALSEIEGSMNKLKNILPKTSLEPISEEDEDNMFKMEQDEIDKIEEARLRSIEEEKKRDSKYIDEEIQAIKRKTKTAAKKIVVVKKPEPKPAPKPEPKSEPVKQEPAPRPIRKSDLSMLESELKDIEAKLSRL